MGMLKNKPWFLRTMVAGPVVGTYMVAKNVISFFRNFDYKNKNVLIVGGSRGLGLEIARQMLELKAKIILVARDAQELERAKEMLGSENVFTVVSDISDKTQIENAISTIKSKHGYIDVLINCAGEIKVGSLDSMTIDDYEYAMKVHYWGPLYSMLAVLPAMRSRKSGRIVNISSIGGKVSIPHLLPYCASKHALVGLSDGMRNELLKENIYITTVCPGLMRTGSHVNANFKGHNKIEYAWFTLLNAFPLASVPVQEAAHQIIEACANGQAELIISLPAQILAKARALFPGELSEVFGFSNRFLPESNNIEAKTGRESQSVVSPSLLTVLADKAVIPNNE
jgi:short-subunit dehydrogenase